MHKLLLITLLFSSYALGMELEKPEVKSLIDQGLVPTIEECEDALKSTRNNNWGFNKDKTALLAAFAQHGPINSLNTDDHFLRSFKNDGNELLEWAISKDNNVVKVLIERGVVKDIPARKFESYLRDALDNLREDIALTLLQARPDFKPDEKNNYDRCTLLQRAAYTGSAQFAHYLLKEHGVAVDGVCEGEKSTPLQLCAETCRSNSNFSFCEPKYSERKRALLLLLIQHKAKYNFEVTTRHENSHYMGGGHFTTKESFLDWCLSNKYDDCVAELIKAHNIWGSTEVHGSFGSVQTLSEWAATNQSMPIVQALIPPCDDSRTSKHNCSSMLKCAMRGRHKALIDYLAFHPNVLKRKSTGQLLMRTAALNGWYSTLNKLVDHYGISLLRDTDDYYNDLALVSCTVSSGNPDMVRGSIALGCDVHQQGSNDTRLPLVKSVVGKSRECTDILLANGAATPQAIREALKHAFSNSASARTFEQLLAYTTDKAIVRELCVKHVSQTPIEYAVSNYTENKRRPLLKAMLEAGFDPNDFEKKNPLKIALGYHDDECVTMLLQYGADPDIELKGGTSPLHQVAAWGSLELVQSFFDSGLKPTKDAEGLTPLVYSIANNTTEVVSYLLDESGFRVKDEIVCVEPTRLKTEEQEEQPATSLTLFEFAVTQNRNKMETLDLLLERGADIERVNERGETPVFWAVRMNNLAAFEWLMAHGAKIDVINHKGQTPLSLDSGCNFVWSVLKDLSTKTGGIISLTEAYDHTKKWKLNTWIKNAQIAEWKKSMKFDPFAKLRELCGIQKEDRSQIAEFIDELEQSIGAHGAYLFEQELDKAFCQNDLVTVEKFLASRPDLPTYEIPFGKTLLHWNARNGNDQLLQDLLNKPGMKDVINKEGRHGETALSESKTVECAQLLLDSGAVVTKNVLAQLIHNKKSDVCTLICKNSSELVLEGADIQKICDSAISYGNKVMAEFCIERGAQLHEKDFSHAVHEGRTDMIAFLKSHNLSVINGNKLANSHAYNAMGSFAQFAVEKKNLALLKEVIEIANDSLINEAAAKGWYEGARCLLDHGLKPSEGEYSDPINSAISSGSVECVELLAHGRSITYDHVKRALNKPDVLSALIPHCKMHACDIESLIASVLRRKIPGSLVHLLKHVKNLNGLDKNEHPYFHILAEYSLLFGATNKRNKRHCSWEDRVKNITWLNVWKQRVLEGNTVDFPADMPDQTVQDAIECVYTLMTAPVYANAQEHKNVLSWLLQRRVNMSEETNQWFTPEPCTAYKHAKSTADSSTFNDLLDPDKIKQWYAAIDKAYAQKNA